MIPNHFRVPRRHLREGGTSSGNDTRSFIRGSQPFGWNAKPFREDAKPFRQVSAAIPMERDAIPIAREAIPIGRKAISEGVRTDFRATRSHSRSGGMALDSSSAHLAGDQRIISAARSGLCGAPELPLYGRG